MKAHTIISTIVLSLLVFYFPTYVRAEEIRLFDAAYRIQRDGNITVQETIQYDFGQITRHGIFRTIPIVKTNEGGKKFLLEIQNISTVNEDDQTYPMTSSLQAEDISVKIGDPNRLITGMQTYVISYLVSGAFTYFSNHDELYWNVTGDTWDVPINRAKATIFFPQEISKNDVTVSCFTGLKGSDASDCSWEFDAKTRSVLVQSNSILPQGEGFTIVIGFPRGIVETVEPKEFISFWNTTVGKITFFGILLFIIGWYVVLPLSIPYRWWKYGRDPKPSVGVASAWFQAPKTTSGRYLTPGETGTLLDERADTQDVVATIIDLARRGYVRIIEERKGDIQLKKNVPPENDVLTIFERILMDGMFAVTPIVALKSGSLVSVVQSVKDALYDEVVQEGFFLKYPNRIRTNYSILGILGLMSGNFPLVLASFLFGMHIPAKTAYGAQLAAVGKSLKNFLISQERQWKFQADKQILFEKMLPFAIAFGVEKLWIARFAAMRLKNPDWYTGYNSGKFNLIAFASTLKSTTNAVSFAATPTTSSRGFSSGFSGGSSGGGGGGGGGGSW